jgi:hypothetical protein
VRGAVRRYLGLRSPRCEFPGCGVLAVRCDVEHDVAWPDGPSCACNCGPCCRRHHRVKQEGWTKSRSADGSVTWTSPTGRRRSSGAQHAALQQPVRPLYPLQLSDHPLDELSPIAREEELWRLGDRPDDPAARELRRPDEEPMAGDDIGRQLEERQTRRSLDLDDPYGWLREELDEA